MMWRHGLLLTLCLALGALTALFSPVWLRTKSGPWSYSDLRLLDPADALHPTQDLVAVYTRSTPGRLQIRLDMLEHAATPDYDLYLALDSRPGGSRTLPVEAQADLEWDLLLVIPASGELQALDNRLQPVPAAGLRVLRDPVLDQVEISLNQATLHRERVAAPLSPAGADMEARVNIQALVTPANSPQIADRSEPSLAGQPPPPPARLLLAFWDAYPAYTPATALRRWNGAHTGALGGSHGLLHLLRAARREGAPLVLLDLKYPAWLSALDFTGGLAAVQQMERDGLLILPEVLPSLGAPQAEPPPNLQATAGRLRQMARDFDLPASPFNYTQPSYFPASTRFPVLLADLTHSAASPGPLAPARIGRRRDQSVIPILRYQRQESQAQMDGPSLDVRRALSQAALEAARPGGETTLLVLGGDLPESAWGAPAAASATLHYLKSRPWIHWLTAQELLAVSGTSDFAFDYETTNRRAEQEEAALLEALSMAPGNALTEAAWQAALALTAPVFPDSTDLPALRANYRGQVWSLLAAAAWAAHPVAISQCGVDPDQDGQAECILASEQFYAQFEIASGGLTFLFQRQPGGSQAAHQIIGPSSQMISGLSDPQSWDLNGGLSADPAVIPGAFSETGMSYQPTLSGDRLVFTGADGASLKTYQLLPAGLRATIRTATPKTVQIPLLLDPWQRFEPGWSARYQHAGLPSGWRLTLEDDQAGPIQVEIFSNASLTAQMFSDASEFTSQAEKPDLDYPPGYFLPFPLLEIALGAGARQDTIIEIRFTP